MTPDLHAGKYAAYIWPAYGVTAVVFLALVAGSLRHARRWRRRVEELRRK
jgi:heme exporter protein D